MVQKGPFLHIKLAIERLKRLETTRNLLMMMRFCLPVILSYLDAGFEPRRRSKAFWITCCYLLPTLENGACLCGSHPHLLTIF